MKLVKKTKKKCRVCKVNLATGRMMALRSSPQVKQFDPHVREGMKDICEQCGKEEAVRSKQEFDAKQAELRATPHAHDPGSIPTGFED